MIKLAKFGRLVGANTKPRQVKLEDFLYSVNGDPTDRQLEVARFLLDNFNRHIESPEMTPPGQLTRSTIDFSDLSKDDLLGAGFVPSVIAVPEVGQSHVTTYRHPLNGMHFHRHGPKWWFHDDKWSSAQMEMKKYDIEHPQASDVDRLKYLFTEVLPTSAGHIVHEGFPGYVNYVNNSILGIPGFDKSQSVSNVSPTRAAKGIGTTALALALARKMATGKARPLESLLTTGGFVGSTIAADKLGDYLTKKNPDVFGAPGVANTAIRGVMPVAGALATDYLARKTMDWLNGSKKKKKKKRKTTKRK